MRKASRQSSISVEESPDVGPSFGKWLRTRRRALDVTQDQLAHLVGCAQVTIRKIEADELLPSKHLAEILAEKLNVPAPERDAFVKYARSGKRSDSVSAKPSVIAPWREEQRRNNLPLKLTSFIGRELEIEEVKRLLGMTRLLSLTGAGGIGKTRLSLQVATKVLWNFPDGVWFVELASLTAAEQIAPRMANALGIFQQEGRAIQSLVTDYLRDKSCLLVFDNCEHLVEGCGRLADSLLHECRGIKILASSRESFNLAGETVFRVPSLRVPDTKNLPPLESLARCEAVRLFLDRALAIQPTFRVTAQNAPALAQICSRLDGIPLALELAAVRVKTLSVEQIVERLDDRFRLLTGGSRTALPRQQTLRAAIDWSYELLSETERVLLWRVAVFAGGWTLEAVESICGDDEQPEADEGAQSRTWSSALCQEDVLDTLSQLVDKSLVIAEGQDGKVRYRMLETIRQYAREKLLESGESEPLRDFHLEFYLKFSEEAEPKLTGAEQSTWLDRVETEYDNVRLALEWSLSGDRVEKGLRMIGALNNLWYTRGYWSEAYQILLEALNLPSASRRTIARAKALRTAGQIANYLGHLDDSHAFFEESIAILREIGNEGRPLMENVLGSLAYVLLFSDIAAARVFAEEGMRLSRESGNRLALAVALNVMGLASHAIGNFDSARIFYEEGSTIARELGENLTYSTILGNLGYMYRDQGDLSRAKEYLGQSLAISREIGSRRIWGWAMEQLAEIARRSGQYDEAESLFKQALIELQQLGDKRFSAIALLHLGRLHLDKRNYSQAAQHLSDSLPMFRGGYQVFFIPWSLESFAFLSTALDKPLRAARLYGAAEALREKLGTPLLPIERAEYEPYLLAARAQLDETSFDAAWNEGRAMALEQAIEYALRETT